MVGRRRYERDAGDSVARLGDDVVHLEARQLSALAGLRTLRHLDLYLLGVHQILRRHAEASRGYLLRLARQAHAVHRRVIAGIVLAALAGVRARAQTVHGQGQRLVRLDAECTERHGTGDEVLHDALHRLDLVNRRRLRRLLKSEEVAQEDGRFLLVDGLCPFLELLVAALTGGQLQLRNRLRVPGVLDAVPAPRELPVVRQCPVCRCITATPLMQPYRIPRNLLQPDAADGAHLRPEVAAQHLLADADALEYLRPSVRPYGRDAHLRHNLLQSLVHGLDVVPLRRRVFLLYLPPLHQVVQHGKRHIRTQCRGSVAQQQRRMHHLANLAALHYQRRLHTLAYADQVVVNSRDRQQRRDGRMRLVDVAVTEDDVVDPFVHAPLSFMAEVVECLAQSLFTLLDIEEDS